MWQRVARFRHISSMHTVKPTDPSREPAPEREQKMAALSYLNEAWAEARLDGIDDDCMAQACLFAAFAELVSTYGEDAAAKYADRLSKRIRNGEFTVEIVPPVDRRPGPPRRDQFHRGRISPNSRFSTASMSLAKNGL